MKKPKLHPRLVMLDERFGSHASALTLSGFVGPSAEGVVRIFSTPNGGECIEISESAIVHYEQPDASGPTELFIEPSAMVTVVSTRKVPIVALALRRQDGGPGDAGPEKTCVEKRIEKCKSDPLVKDKSFCDSETAKSQFQLFCDLFGDPKVVGSGSGSVIV